MTWKLAPGQDEIAEVADVTLGPKRGLWLEMSRRELARAA